jgi:hypothetical protein
VFWSFIGALIAIALAARLAFVFNRKRQSRARHLKSIFSPLQHLIEGAVFEPQGPNQYPKLKGAYKNFPVQILPVVDTLATRRLPALWLLVTVQDNLPLTAKFDLMMRPAGPTTFSNFDLLGHTLKPIPGFPDEGVVRTDDPDSVLPGDVVRPHLGLFASARAKELLIAPTGLRLVWLLAEADRARYGVLREADFGEVEIDAGTVEAILDALLALRLDILKWSKSRT